MRPKIAWHLGLPQLPAVQLQSRFALAFPELQLLETRPEFSGGFTPVDVRRIAKEGALALLFRKVRQNLLPNVGAAATEQNFSFSGI